MKSLKWLFVVVMTTITVLSIFLLADIVLMGIIALIISPFSQNAMQVFKVGIAVLFCIEFLLTIPAVIKSRNEGDKSNGS